MYTGRHSGGGVGGGGSPTLTLPPLQGELVHGCKEIVCCETVHGMQLLETGR